MSTEPHPPPQAWSARPPARYALALALVLVALAARFALIGVLPAQGFPFLTFFPAVMVTAYVAGLGPGLFAAALSILAARYWFVAPAGTWVGASTGDHIAIGFFAAILVVDCLIVHVMARALQRVRRSREELAGSRARLLATEADLRAADRHKDAFLATLAHELRNPLGPVAGAAHVLAQATLPGPRERAAAQALQRQVGYMARLLDDLLDVSRVSHGKLVLQPAPVSLDAIVDDAVAAARALLDARGHAFALQRAAPGLWIHADAVRIEQILVNLLNNAARYTPPGGRIDVLVSVDAARGDVAIAVRDTGIGLSEAQRERIFGLFAQAGEPGTGGGLGIGLSLARELARLHGGDVRASSAGPGQGSEFAMHLPGLLCDEPAGPAALPAAPLPAAPRRVLVVDDNRDGADVLVMACGLSGHAAHAAYDAAGALAAMAPGAWDMAILDIGLPDLDGVSLGRRLRAIDPGLRLVAVSGWGREQDRAATDEAGFEAHLVKPVDPARILELLELRFPTPA